MLFSSVSRVAALCLPIAVMVTTMMSPLPAAAADSAASAHPAQTDAKPEPGAYPFTPQLKLSDGVTTVRGHHIAYQAAAGTLIVHPKGWDDAAPENKTKPQDEPVAAIFYVAYFKKGVPAASRPITFVYNGGPGSASVWLHMGAFGPRRIRTADDTHTPAAPYTLIDNDDSLLDAEISQKGCASG